MLSEIYKISYSPREEREISKLAEKLYIDELNSISEVEAGNITLKTMYVFQHSKNIEVKVFIFNGTNQSVNFSRVPLFLVNENSEVIAGEFFNLTELGEIPSMNVRPYNLSFSINDDTKIQKITDKCKVVIGTSETEAKEAKKLVLSFMDPKIEEYERIAILKHVHKMETVVENSIKFIPYKSGIDSENNKYCILFIANGANKIVEIKGLNLVCRNRMGIIEGCKRIEGIPDIEPRSILVYKFIFEKSDIMQEYFNPENCTITIEN